MKPAILIVLIVTWTAVWAFWIAPVWPGSCRLALSIGMDVSSSVDDTEWRMQRAGLATALRDPEVRDAFLSGETVMLQIFEWSERSQIVMDWRPIGSAADLDSVASHVAAAPRSIVGSVTHIGDAMLFAGRELDATPCAERVMDISGDDPINGGAPAPVARDSEHVRWTEVNGLVVGGDPNTVKFYEKYVKNGKDAFVVVANDFADFADAMTRKLIREAQNLM